MFKWLKRKRSELPESIEDFLQGRPRMPERIEELLAKYPSSFDPEQHPIAYHYCDKAAFLSIIANKALWLSDINSMNDYSEGHWGYERFVEAANRVIGTVGVEVVEQIDEVFSSSGLRQLFTLCCFSTNGDSLSQWRSYANDGAGVAVGFDTRLLQRLNARLSLIEYDREKQVSHFSDFITTFADEKQNNKEFGEPEQFYACAMMASDTTHFKNPAFAEESEIRLSRALVVTHDNSGFDFNDVGGLAPDEKSRESLDVKFRPRGDGIVTYVELPIVGLGQGLIRHVVLGPKSRNGAFEVEVALRKNGLNGAKVSLSSATYR